MAVSEPINYHPHSRFTLHEKANLYPFRDILWGRTDGPFIDLKVDYPDPANHYADGTAFLRTEDVVEMAHCLGMSTREETEALKAEIQQLKAQVAKIPTLVEEYKNELSGTTAAFLDRLAGRESVDLPVVEKPKAPPIARSKKAPKAPEPVLSDEQGSERDDSGSGESDESNLESSAKPVGSEGSDDVSGSVDNTAADPLSDFFGFGKD